MRFKIEKYTKSWDSCLRPKVEVVYCSIRMLFLLKESLSCSIIRFSLLRKLTHFSLMARYIIICTSHILSIIDRLDLSLTFTHAILFSLNALIIDFPSMASCTGTKYSSLILHLHASGTFVKFHSRLTTDKLVPIGLVSSVHVMNQFHSLQ